MFERFTERARQVVVLAQDEARALKHNYIGTEHILLGIVRVDKSVGAQVLVELGADAEAIRNELVGVLGSAAPGPLRRFPRRARRSRLSAIEQQLTEIVERLEAIERRLGERPE